MWDSFFYAVVFLHFDKSFMQPHSFAFAFGHFLTKQVVIICRFFFGKGEGKLKSMWIFDCQELCLLKNEAISIPNNLLPEQYYWIICRRRIRNKTVDLLRVFDDRRTER